ncbi:MAG: hypothetical protein JW727_00285 [Candidatus Aenigmarchaeota archaeon]|nr:hypothetical protein [Candidatus Aenigmarchaeota archaeon]
MRYEIVPYRGRKSSVRRRFALIGAAILLMAVLVLFTTWFEYPFFGQETNSSSNQSDNSTQAFGSMISSGWTLTSYCLADESLYRGQKVEIFDSDGATLGFYRSDFIEKIQIEGSGIGDGDRNPGQYIAYDFEINDGKTCYLTDEVRGAFGLVLNDWTEDLPSIAINPPLPAGTEVILVDLGSDAGENTAETNQLLLNRTFIVQDTFFGFPETEKKIDIFIGRQKRVDYSGPESFFMKNVTVLIKLPES